MIENKQSEITENHLLALSKVDRLIKQIVTPELPFEILDTSIRQLEALIFELDSENEEVVQSYYNTLAPNLVKSVNDKYCLWETVFETQFSESILNERVTSISEYHLYDRFKNLIKKELDILGSINFESILFIGSGPFPITAILLHQFADKRIDCLECNQDSAKISVSILQKLGLADKIKVHVGDGCTFDVSKFDVVLNALLAKPKHGILKNIRSSNKKAVVLCRTSFGLRQLVYEGTSENSLNGFFSINKQLATFNDTISTLLLINKKHLTESINPLWVNSLGDIEKAKLIEMMNGVIKNDNNNGFLTTMNKDHPYIEVLERDIKLGIKHLLVIENDNKYLGQLIINHSYVDTYKHRAEISTLMLDETIRGKEISLLITQYLIEKCDELNIKYLTLSVRSGSKVELLWKYMGFDVYGELPCYSEVGGNKYKGTYMHKDLETLRISLFRKLENLYK